MTVIFCLNRKKAQYFIEKKTVPVRSLMFAELSGLFNSVYFTVPLVVFLFMVRYRTRTRHIIVQDENSHHPPRKKKKNLIELV